MSFIDDIPDYPPVNNSVETLLQQITLKARKVVMREPTEDEIHNTDQIIYY
jgi:hypothetical protein